MHEDNQIQTICQQRDLVVIQRNPTSGSGRGRREVFRLFKELQRRGFEVRVYHNRSRFSRYVNRPAVANRASVADRLRCLVAAGGDGTISSLVQRHPEFPIAVLPLGTENLVAKHFDLKCDGADLADVIEGGRSMAFDTGLVEASSVEGGSENSGSADTGAGQVHRFLLMASAGLDAEVVRLLAMARQGNISHFSYLKPIVTSFLRYRFPKLEVVNEHGETIAVGSHVLVSNMPEYGMKIPFCPTANPHDGLLDVRVFQQSGMVKTAWHVLKTRWGRQDSAKEVVRFQAPAISLKTEDSEVPLQADGDPCGTGCVTFRVADEKMKLLVPSTYSVTD
ncbi:MAG: diacylglycerol kinase family protein [Fuerstiella sp.]